MHPIQAELEALDLNEADREAPLPSGRGLRILLLATFLHGLVYLLLLPAWMGEDEPWHFENLTHVANGHWAKSERVYEMEDQQELPLTQIQALRRFDGLSEEDAARVQTDILASMRANDFWKRVDWAGREDRVTNFDEVAWGFSTSQQPPLYYFVAAPLVAMTESASLETQLLTARFLSLLLFVATVYLTVLAARMVFQGDERLALLAAFFAAWFPMHARMSAVVNNDVLARFLVTLTLVLAMRLATRVSKPREWIALVLVVLLGIATKTTAYSGVAVAALGFLFVPRELGKRSRKWLMIPALLALTGLAVVFWQSMHNPAVPYSMQELAKRFDYALSPRAFIEVRDSFLGTFNWESRPQPAWIRSLFGWIWIAALAGTLLELRRPSANRRLVLLCLGTFVAQFSLILLRGVGKGRYLMPALAALAILFVIGLVQSLPERWRTRMSIALVVLLVAYDALFLWSGLIANQYLLLGSG